MTSKSKYINDIIDLLPAPLLPRIPDNEVEITETQFEQEYGYFPCAETMPNSELYTAMIEANLVNFINEETKPLKTLTITQTDHIQLLKALPLIKNTDKIQKIILRTPYLMKIQDDPFMSLIRCKDLALEELDISYPIIPNGFKTFCEKKTTMNLKVLTIRFTNYSNEQEKFKEIISILIDNSANFPKLTKLIIFIRPKYIVPLDILIKVFNKKVIIELNLECVEYGEVCNIEFKNLDEIKEIKSLLEVSIRIDNNSGYEEPQFQKLVEKVDMRLVKKIDIDCANVGDYFQPIEKSSQCILRNFRFVNMRREGDLPKLLSSERFKSLEVLDLGNMQESGNPSWLKNMLSLKNLQELKLYNTGYFTTDNWIEFADKAEFTGLKKLNLNSVQNINSVVIAKICSNFKALEHLCLENTRLNDDCLKALESTKLKELDISDNTFNEPALISFVNSNGFKSIRKIGLWSIGLDNLQIINNVLLNLESDVQALKISFDTGCFIPFLKCKNLKNVSLNSAMSFSHMSFGNHHLEALLNSNPEDGVKVAYLKKLWQIRIVNRSQNKITEETLIKFVGSQNLNPFFNKNDFLNVVANAYPEIITNKVMEAMANNKIFMKYLIKLDVRNFKSIQKEGIEAILKSPHISPIFDWNFFLQGVKENPSLQPTKEQPLLREQLLKLIDLNKFEYLKRIDFSKFDFKNIEDDQFFNFFSRGLSNLKSLSLSQTNLDDKLLVRVFSSDLSKKLLNSLYFLSLNDNAGITEEGFDNFLDLFTENTELIGLELDKCQITNAHLKKITTSNLKNKLRYLSIKECKKIDYEGLETLIQFRKDNPSFKIMNIYRDYTDILCINQQNQQISVLLKVEDVYKIQRILVNGDQENDQQMIEELKKQRTNVSNIVLKKFLEEERRIETFKILDFSDCSIDSEGLTSIANCIFLMNLQTLSLNNTLITDVGIKALTDSKILRLRNLNIEGCKKLSQESLKYILDCKHFHPEFNPEKILENYAHLINKIILNQLDKSNYYKNVKVIFFQRKNKGSMEQYECLEKLIELENTNLLVKIDELPQLMIDIKERITDVFLEKFVKSRIFTELPSLELGQKVTHKGFRIVIEAPLLNKDFDIQSLILNYLNLMSDSVLESLSKSRCFWKFQYSSKLFELNKQNEENEKLKKNEETKKLEETKNEEVEEAPENKITSEGLWYLSLSSNENFDIQGLFNDFGEMITSSFIKNMVQQPYFRKICKKEKADQTKSISYLNLIGCPQLKEDDLCVIIKSSHPDFNLEEFIKSDHLPNKEMSLVTNNVLKAIAKSAFIKKNYYKPSSAINFDSNSFKRFNFDVSKYPKVDYAINDLIQAHASQIRHYAVYLQNYTAYLSSESLRIMRNDIMNYQIFNLKMKNKHKKKEELRKNKSTPYKDEEEIFNKLSKIKVLKFSQNKFIYDPSFEISLRGAFVNFQNQNDLNLNNKTINYYVKEIATIQEKNTSPDLFDKDHIVLLDLIKLCNNLEEINLDNLNLGDDFLKNFSIYLSEKRDNFKNLEIFELKNNARITSVGLKYLYCSIINRCDVLKVIKVDDEEARSNNKDYDASTFTNFVNNGLKGMIDSKLDQISEILSSIYKDCLFKVMHPKKKDIIISYVEKETDEEEGEFLAQDEKTGSSKVPKRKSKNNQIDLLATNPGELGSVIVKRKATCFVKFIASIKFLTLSTTLEILGLCFLFSPVLLFHYFERFIFTVPRYLNSCMLWMKNTMPFKFIVKPLIFCWVRVLEKFYDCFGNCFHIVTGKGKKSEKANNPKKSKEEPKTKNKSKPEKKDKPTDNNNISILMQEIEEIKKKYNSLLEQTEKKTPQNDKKEMEKEKKVLEKLPRGVKTVVDFEKQKPEEEEHLNREPNEETKEEGKEKENEDDQLTKKGENKVKEGILKEKSGKEISLDVKDLEIPKNKSEMEEAKEKEKENPETESPKQDQQKPSSPSFSALFCSFWSCIKLKKEGKKLAKEELVKRYRRCKREIRRDSKKLNPGVDDFNEWDQEDALFDDEKSVNNSPPQSPKKIQSSGPIDLESNRSAMLAKKDKVVVSVNYSSYFYYDESLISLNTILFGKSLYQKKTNVVSPILEANSTDAKEQVSSPIPLLSNSVDNQNEFNQKIGYNPFLIISKMKWVILIDFIIFYILVIFYLLYIKLILNEDASLQNQVPYFVYGFCGFILECCLCWEVTSIINNEELTSMWDSTVLSNLITSQTAKYDTFTNLSFALINLKFNSVTKKFEPNEIFIPAMFFVGLNIVLNFKNFLGFFWKNFLSKKHFKSSYHSSENINRYSKLCFQFEFQSLGRLLDRFSTNSAKKYDYWFLPKTLKNTYIPTVITTTFARLFFEDVPLLIIQIYVLISQSHSYDFTSLASLVSTILALFMTLHTTWNVKPSTFNKNLFMRFFTQTKNVKESQKKKENEILAKQQAEIKLKKELDKTKNKDTTATTILEKKFDDLEEKDDEREINDFLATGKVFA